jgi:hypothetical protein
LQQNDVRSVLAKDFSKVSLLQIDQVPYVRGRWFLLLLNR